VKLSQADFRPRKRLRHVPRGSPKRGFPLIRLALLLAAAVLIYTRFDDIWPRVRDAMNPSSAWTAISGAFGPDEARENGPAPEWSADSSRFFLDCPGRLDAACCAAAGAISPDLCGEAAALLARARWKRAAGELREGLRLEGRAVVNDLGIWDHELSGMRGRDESGAFHFRLAAGGRWCDAGRGCLGNPAPTLPLAGGRSRPAGEPAATLWTGDSPRVRALLPGRVMAVEPLAAGGARVRVYHGREIYADYEPIRPAPGVQPGARVRAGSHLGDAPRTGSGHAFTLRLLQTGLPVDPAGFWGFGERETALPSGNEHTIAMKPGQ
jgi:hypothetical protein